MPTYDYRCDACGHEFEEFQSITAKPLKKCPECSKNSLKRLIGTGAGIIFKGSGFYETDYRSDSYKKAAKAEKSSASSSSDSSDSSKTSSSGDSSSNKSKSESSSTSKTPASSSSGDAK